MDDESIIGLYFARNERAIAETEARYGRFCMALSENILHRRQDAEECVNDTWTAAWNSIPPTRPLSLKAYLGRIVRNLSFNKLKARKHRDTELCLEELAECLPADDRASSGELAALLDEFLAALDPDERRLFVGRYWYAYPVKRLAAALGLSENAASHRLGRTRAALRAFLTERGYPV